MEPWRQELYHHGIKGQKWGVRNGPPYPLGASDHSASEKRAGWRKSLSRPESDSVKREKVSRSEISGNINHPNKMSSYDVEKGKALAKKALIAIGVTAAVGVGVAIAVKAAKKGKVEEIVKGLIQRNADVSIESLGQTFSSPKDFANRIDELNRRTQELEKDGKLFDSSYWQSLSEDQRKAVKEYTSGGYMGMNELLRNGAGGFSQAGLDGARKLIKDCAEAIEGCALQEDAVTYRQVSKHALNKMLGFDITSTPLTEKTATGILGLTFLDKGFYSSAVGGANTLWFSSDVKITTILPKGTKAMYLEPITNNGDELEMLVQRGTRFAVKDFTTNDSGIINGLIVEAVSQP